MASKDPDLDKPDLDDDLDIPDFDDSMLDGGNDKRTPIDKVTGGFYNGLKTAALNRSNQREMIRNALPAGYGKAVGDAESAVDLGQDLYDTARENLVPVRRDLKKIGRYVAGKTKDIFPPGLQARLEELVAPEDVVDERLAQIDLNKVEMTSAVSEVFGDFLADQSQKQKDDQSKRLRSEVRTRNLLGAQLDLAMQRDQRDNGERFKEDLISEARWKTESNLLNMMRSGVERLVDYQDRVTASYQRKSLELQYRQFFVARDHYALSQAFVKQTNEHLNAVVKNTAMPEFVKTQTNEAARAMLRERMLGKVGGMVQNKTAGLKEKLTKAVGNVTGNFAEGIRSASNTMDMVDDVPIDQAELGGQIGGDVAGSSGMAALAKKLGMTLGRNDTVSRIGNNLEYYSDNKSEMVRDYLMGQRDSMERTGFGGAVDATKGSLAEMMLGFMGSKSPEASFGRDATELASEASPYTSLADKSITEIIPGLLGEILHETEMMRTSDASTPRRGFDFETGEISTQGATQRRLVKRALPEGRMESIRDDLTTIVDRIDPDRRLSDDARMAFTRQMLSDASQGRRFDPVRYFEPGGLYEVADEDLVGEIRHLIKEGFLRDDGGFRKYDRHAVALRSDSARVFNRAKEDIPNYQETIARLMPLYGARTLREAGLVTQDQAPGETRADTASILDYINLGETSNRGEPTDEVSDVRRRDGAAEDETGGSFGRHGLGGGSGVDPRGLDRVVGVLERLVEVQRSDDLRRQFEHVLDAIGKINPLKHLDLNARWLKDIYTLLKDSLGGGPGGGPSGGPSGPQGPSRRDQPKNARTGLTERQQDRWGDVLGSTRGSVSQLDAARGRRELNMLPVKMKSMFGGAQARASAVGEDSTVYGQSMDTGMGRVAGSASVSMNDQRYDSKMGDIKKYLQGHLPDEDSRQQLSDLLNRGKDKGRQLRSGLSDKTQQLSVLGADTTDTVMTRLNIAGGELSEKVAQKSKASAQLGRDVLNRVVEQVQRRMISSGGGDGGGSDNDGTGGDSGDGYWARAQGLLDQLMSHLDRKTEQLQTSIENLTLAEMAGASTEPGMLKRLGRGAASGVGGIMSFYGGVWSSVGNLAKGGTGMLGNLAGKMFSGGRSESDGVMDIYLQGQNRPVMLARDLRLGRYFDQQTGDIVQRIDEITGPVIDDKGDVVISQYDLDEGLLVNREGASVMDRIKSLTGGLTSAMTSPYRAMFSVAGSVLSTGKSWLTRPRDIYVKGENKPRLLAVIMKNGGYVSAASGKVINSLRDIDGEVKDRQGNVVLSHADIQQGLTDWRGKAIRGLLSGAKSAVKGVVKGVTGYLSGAYKAMGGLAKGAFNLTRGGGGGEAEEGGGFSLLGSSSKQQVSLLKEIRDILDDRMEKPLRKGGWRSQLYGDDQEASSAPRSAREKAKARDRDSAGGGMLDKLKGMLGLGGAGAAAVGAGLDVAGGLLPGARPPATPPARPTSKLGRLWGGLKKVGGSVGRGIGTAAKFAIPAALMGGKALAIGAGKALLGLGSAAASVLSAPVVLAAGAVAAVGVGGYLAYRHFSRQPDGPLHRVRLAQYGANPDDKDQVGQIALVEDAMEDEVQFDGKRLATLGKGIDLEEVMDDFGVDISDQVAVSRWLMWFQERFKPVYLSHAVIAKDMTGSADLTETDDMDSDLKRSYLRRTQFKGDQMPYGSVSPFVAVSRLPGVEKVNEELEKALKTLPPPSEADRTDALAEAETDRRTGNRPTPEAVVSASAAMKATQRAVAPKTNRNGRPVRIVTSPVPAASQSASKVPIAAASGISDPWVEKSTEARLAAESEAMSQGRQIEVTDGASDRAVSQRARQERIARQTAVQANTASVRMSEEMSRMVTVLTASHTTQQSMDHSLKEINAYFQDHKKQRDLETRKQPASGRGTLSRSGGESDKPLPAGVPLT